MTAAHHYELAHESSGDAEPVRTGSSVKSQYFRSAFIPAPHALIFNVFGIGELELAGEFLANRLGYPNEFELV